MSVATTAGNRPWNAPWPGRPAARRRLRALAAGPAGGGALLLASCLSIQAGAAAATTTFGTIAPGAAAGWRFALAAIGLLLVVRPRVGTWSAQRWRVVGLLGLAAAANELCLYLALDRLPLGTAVTLEFLGPLGLALAAVRRPAHAMSAALALGGVVLLSGTSAGGDAAGLALALAAAGGWALYIVASSRAGTYDRQLDSLAVALAVAALATAPLTVASAGTVAHDPDLLPTLAVVAILGTVLPYGLELAALRRLAPAAAGILFSVEPAIAAIVGVVGLGQGLSAAEVAGIAAVVAAGAFTLRHA